MSRRHYGTQYAETEAILAAQLQDTETVEEILSEMLPGERVSLSDACSVLMDLIRQMEDGP